MSKKRFTFIRPGAIASGLNENDLVAYEPLDYHDGAGSNALFGDGHVSWLTPSELEHFKMRPTTLPSTQPADR